MNIGMEGNQREQLLQFSSLIAQVMMNLNGTSACERAFFVPQLGAYLHKQFGRDSFRFCFGHSELPKRRGGGGDSLLCDFDVFGVEFDADVVPS